MEFPKGEEGTATTSTLSMGETLPGDKILRGSILWPTLEVKPEDLVLWGEDGTERLDFEMEFDVGFVCWIEMLSGLDGGIVNEQHHALRRGAGGRREMGFRREDGSMKKRESF